MASRSRNMLALNDDLLAEILIRLPTLSDLGRACAVSVVFRRVITSRRYTIHPPSLLGIRTFTEKFHPLKPPQPSSAIAYALSRAGDFRFSFLPNPCFWIVRDARYGLFVLDHDEYGQGIFNKIVVCNPFIRRYVLLPPIPRHLASVVREPYISQEECSRKCDVFLASSGEEEAPEMQVNESFRLIWLARCPTKLVIFIFCYPKWQWQAIAIPDWITLSHASATIGAYLLWRSCAYGNFYWLWGKNNKLVVLDPRKMKLSYVSNLPFVDYNQLTIVELGESRCGMFVFKHTTSTTLQLFTAERQNHSEGATEWLLQNEVSLGSIWYNYRILGNADGKLILEKRCQKRSFSREPEFSYISVNIKTLQVERIQGMLGGGYTLPFLYIGYPPPLSLPMI